MLFRKVTWTALENNYYQEILKAVISGQQIEARAIGYFGKVNFLLNPAKDRGEVLPEEMESSDGPAGWMNGWTIFYWGWWIAWSPFVGQFFVF